MDDTSYVNLSLVKYNDLYDKSKRAVVGWRPIEEYNTEDYDWVLIKYFDGNYECVPCVAEKRNDGLWYDRSGKEIPFTIKYFFDMQQLDQLNK